MNVYRCRICGDAYLGSQAPSHCPFCGAHWEHFVDLALYPEDIDRVATTEAERDDLTVAIELETGNARFYLALAARNDRPELASAYKRLAKIEMEHCELFAKLAGTSMPRDIKEAGTAEGDWCASIEESEARELTAMNFYAQAALRATNERIREVFSAISAVEADHIEVDLVLARIAACPPAK